MKIEYFSLTRRADEDIALIFDHISQDNVSAALALVTKFEHQWELLQQTPLMGRLRPDLGNDVRGLPVGNYLVLYRVECDSLEILRVTHGARDIPTIYDE